MNVHSRTATFIGNKFTLFTNIESFELILIWTTKMGLKWIKRVVLCIISGTMAYNIDPWFVLRDEFSPRFVVLTFMEGMG